ncbi:hypothetical protein JG687_00007734 [Phytophthora cactorum]|uniref:Uncharacterized protein n=2 Tax=Phytophthora cactorum TaxID=29920 RepID=A0A8T1UFT2_9STRA|nr:hypothetical protein JG687_00007734 [Phytophthora cactorum]
MKLSEPSKRRELYDVMTVGYVEGPVLGFDKPDGLRKVDRELFFATPASMSVGQIMMVSGMCPIFLVLAVFGVGDPHGAENADPLLFRAQEPKLEALPGLCCD